MHILFFIHSLSAGGAERVAATLANHWAERLWQVTVVTVAGEENDFYRLNERVNRVCLGLDSQSGNLFQALRNNGRRVRALRKVLRQEKPRIAVAMMTTANVTLSLAGWGLGVPTVGAERIHPPALPLGRVWETVRRWSYPRLSGLVAQTRASGDWLRIHAPAPHLVVIPNPLNFPVDSHEPRVRPGDIQNDTHCSHLLLAVGRLDQQKGFDRLLDAFAVVQQARPDWALVILGEGKERASLQEQVSRLGLDQNVRLPGAVGNMGEWFEAADAYALTSRFEGFPNTLLEAMAYGVPSIAVDCETGPREIVHDGVDGLLVPQNDEKALIDALDRLMGDSALRARFGERATEVRDRFAVEQIAGQWERLFHELEAGNDS